MFEEKKKSNVRRSVMIVVVGCAAVFASFPMAAWAAITIETVPVGDAGNAANTRGGGGAVAYNYNIGKYDVTNAQYCEFLNAKASHSDLYGLWNSDMSGSTYGEGGISRSGTGPYTYKVNAGKANQPVVFVSLYDAIRFANWLSNGQGSGDTENGAYAISGSGPDWTVAKPTPAERAAWAAGNKTYWLIPTLDEWCKAAYYKGGGTNSGYWLYPTQSDTAPTWERSTSTGPNPGANSSNFYDPMRGYSVTSSTSWNPSQDYLTDVGAYPNSVSAYGTLDQGGDVVQWSDRLLDSWCNVCGGSFADVSNEMASYGVAVPASGESYGIGFRVAMVPEPGSMALLATGTVISLLVCAWRHRRP
ncbi:MAG: SUMF1/EgtB/PvdO family nonheme iron enzyme [Thermoguttaceae bacterium]|jgi:formylglycine-generating enzyme required for sulfatase activity